MGETTKLKVIAVAAAESSPAQDTTPIKIEGNEFERALQAMETTALAFAESAIKDPKARAEYARRTAQARNELIELVKSRKLTPHQAAQTANAMRNQIMELARATLSDFGLALSKDMKAAGRPLDYMQTVKARELFGKSFEALSATERDAVWLKIVDSAGKSNPKVNMRVRWYGYMGRGLMVFTLAVAVYNVSTAEDPTRQAAKEGTAIAGGIAGGVAATGGLAFIASNPAGWLVGLVMLVGAAIGGIGSSSAFEYFWPENAN